MERKTKVFKEMKEVWEASDGTTFFKQEECEKYENSEMGIVWQRFKALPKTILSRNLLLFYESEDYIIFKMAMTDEAKKVMAHLCTDCSSSKTIEKILAVPDGTEVVFDMGFGTYGTPPNIDAILYIGTVEEVRQDFERWLSDEGHKKLIKEATGEDLVSSGTRTELQMMGILKDETL